MLAPTLRDSTILRPPPSLELGGGRARADYSIAPARGGAAVGGPAHCDKFNQTVSGSARFNKTIKRSPARHASTKRSNGLRLGTLQQNDQTVSGSVHGKPRKHWVREH